MSPHVMSMRPRVVESCLLGGERLAYLSIEGPNANPSSMELLQSSATNFCSKIRNWEHSHSA